MRYFALPFIYSNGGQVASDDGQKLLLNQPAAVEALQQNTGFNLPLSGGTHPFGVTIDAFFLLHVTNR